MGAEELAIVDELKAAWPEIARNIKELHRAVTDTSTELADRVDILFAVESMDEIEAANGTMNSPEEYLNREYPRLARDTRERVLELMYMVPFSRSEPSDIDKVTAALEKLGN